MSSDQSQSLLCSTAKSDLVGFKWDTLHKELSAKAPILLSVLEAATKTRIPRKNATIVVCTCAALLLRCRNHKMNLVQKIISLILYAGHSAKKVIYI